MTVLSLFLLNNARERGISHTFLLAFLSTKSFDQLQIHFSFNYSPSFYLLRVFNRLSVVNPLVSDQEAYLQKHRLLVD